MDWNIVYTLGILMVGIGGFYFSNTSRYITVREHEALIAAIQRELDKLSGQIRVLEQTRPTTGELRALIERRVDTRNPIEVP